jgi:hypothetical protein
MSVVCVYARVCVRGGVMRGVCYADEDATNDDDGPVMLRDGGSIKKREKKEEEDEEGLERRGFKGYPGVVEMRWGIICIVM